MIPNEDDDDCGCNGGKNVEGCCRAGCEGSRGGEEREEGMIGLLCTGIVAAMGLDAYGDAGVEEIELARTVGLEK